ncbi:hypothetical protein [Bacillus gaemokensis]|uniref:DUF4879 domain-containing protein n=1 Tax=Bacillus gaemokensis TaxID=574375 RepID=A0A073KDG5_9BACI|nr:hypothetical protein [Bacillus gaemokensis]KEK20353.1 hypothetical protein BAGA_29760 [Bacillus gaemokensis]KYG29192.1 hypothetical protein AZF08_27860 [Bacillus gaemokensis]
MFKKLAIGALATGVLLSGAGGVFAAEQSQAVDKKVSSNLLASVNVGNGQTDGDLYSISAYHLIPVKASSSNQKSLTVDMWGHSDTKISIYEDSEYGRLLGSWKMSETPKTVSINPNKTYYLRIGVMPYSQDSSWNYVVNWQFK